VELTARSTHPLAPKAEHLLFREAILKNASYDLYMASVRPSGRTGELTSPVNSAPALRGKIFDFAVVAVSLRAGSLRRPRRLEPDRQGAGADGGFAAFTPPRKE